MTTVIKSFLTKTVLTLFLLFLAVGVKAQKNFTVYSEATNTHGQVPISGVCYNYYTKTQYVIPAANLTSLVDGGIYCLVYWPNELNGDKMFSGDVNVYMKEVDYTTISKFEPVTNADLVYSGPLTIQKSNNLRLVLIALNKTFVYKGGNLLIDFENKEPGDPVGKKFYGKNVTGASISASEKTKEDLEKAEPYQHNFIPRTSFLYYYHPDITDVTSTPTTATVSWTDGNKSYQLRYGEMSFFDDFEDGLNGWTVVRNQEATGTADTDWHIHRDYSDTEAYDGEHSLITRSWYDGVKYSTDCWLISPKIELGGTLKFWVRDDGQWHEKYKVYVSTTTNDTTSFKLLASPDDASRTWSEVSIDLSDYEGFTGYIALRDQNSDQDYLLLDRFGVYRNSKKWTEVTTESSSYTIQNLKEDAPYLVEVRGLSTDYVSRWQQCVVMTHSNPMPFDASDSQTTAHASTISWSGYGDSYQLGYRKDGNKNIIAQSFEKGGDYEGWTLKECASGTSATSNQSACHTGYAGFAFNTIHSTTPQYLISPKLAPVTEGALFSFYYKVYSTANTESFRVGFSSTTDDIDAFTFGETITYNKSAWTEFKDDVPVGTKYVCIQCTSQQKHYLFVDDLEINQSQTPNDMSMIVDINAKSTTLEGLDPDSQYEVFIRSLKDHKAGNTASDWMRAYHFKTLRALPLADDDTSAEKKNTELLDDYNTIEVDVEVAPRAFTEATPSTVCLPFDYTPEDGIGTFYTFSGIEKIGNDYVATMEENGVKTLTANTPYLFMPAATGEVDFSGVHTISATDDPSTTSDDWTFLGTYDEVKWDEAPTGIYGFSAQAVDDQGISQGEFVKVGAKVKIRPFRAYLKYKDGSENYSGARAFTRSDADELPASIMVRFIDSKGNTTAIGTVDTQTGEVNIDREGWYTLSGRRLPNKPTQRGIYINNGNKVLIK